MVFARGRRLDKYCEDCVRSRAARVGEGASSRTPCRTALEAPHEVAEAVAYLLLRAGDVYAARRCLTNRDCCPLVPVALVEPRTGRPCAGASWRRRCLRVRAGWAAIVEEVEELLVVYLQKRAPDLDALPSRSPLLHELKEVTDRSRQHTNISQALLALLTARSGRAVRGGSSLCRCSGLDGPTGPYESARGIGSAVSACVVCGSSQTRHSPRPPQKNLHSRAARFAYPVP